MPAGISRGFRVRRAFVSDSIQVAMDLFFSMTGQVCGRLSHGIYDGHDYLLAPVFQQWAASPPLGSPPNG
jgi:hypothetical protein